MPYMLLVSEKNQIYLDEYVMTPLTPGGKINLQFGARAR